MKPSGGAHYMYNKWRWKRPPSTGAVLQPGPSLRYAPRTMTSRRHAFAALFLAVLLPVAPGLAAEGLEDGGRAVVSEVVDGDTVRLDRAIAGATQVRLVGIQAPKLPLGRPGFVAWPLAQESKRALEAMVLGRAVRFGHGGRRRDRHGRLLAHLHVEDGAGGDDRWVQGELLRLGMARVYTFSDNRRLAAEMLALEGAARTLRRGIWAHPFYAVRAPQETGRLVDTFQIVEGKVLDAARVKSRVYLNFGLDWRTDFTVAVSPKARRLFEDSGLDPGSLKGRRVRVRGWIKRFNGPLIDASHPEQIEVLPR